MAGSTCRGRAAGNLYGIERLIALLDGLPDGMTTDAIVKTSQAAVKLHARGAEPSDEITLMALVWRGDSLMDAGDVAVSTPLDE